MKRINIIIFLLAIATGLAAQTTTGSFTYDNLLRDYILFVPSGYNASQPTPLVINMHGYTSNASQQMAYTAFNNDADTAGYIVVYPNGVNNAWNSGFAFPYESGIDDVGFLSALIDTIATHYNVDDCRVHATGMSNGGYMSYRLACELYDKIASIASVTGSMSTGMTTHCNTTRPVATMQIHGTADPTVPYNGNASSTGAEANLQYWADKNPCFGPVLSQDLPDIVSDGTTVTKLSYNNCAGNTEVVLFKVVNGGHTWPDAIIDIGTTTKDINANSEIIQFFNKHPRCGATSIEDTKVSEETLTLSPNPVTDILSISTDMIGALTVSIHDISGKLISAENYQSGPKHISTTQLKAGFYTIHITNGKENAIARFVKD